ncbi:MAG: DUF2283 domain-containing protein [Anaerolineales bacterium]|nr:DUF2283 domain-containing protein [Anaerolineales bacterium]
MQIDYDPQADAIYIRLRKGEVDDTLEAGKYVYVDVDENGVPLGLEILFAGRILAKEDVTSVTVNIGRLTQVIEPLRAMGSAVGPVITPKFRHQP